MTILLLALLPFALAAAPADADPGANPCKPGATQAGTRIPEIRARKLGDMPDATAIRAVYNKVEGCPTPIVLRDGIGSNPTAARSRTDGQARPAPLR